MKDLGHAPFIQTECDREPLVTHSIPPFILDEYIQSDQDRCISAGSITFPVVYDYLEQSPYYEGEGKVHGPFIDERDLIELPSP